SFFFFFSSRRRHTRSKRDWSSDVCSSDLEDVPETRHSLEALHRGRRRGQGRGERRENHEKRTGPPDRCHGGPPLSVPDRGVRGRSEERRVGKECRGGWTWYQ